MDISVLVGTRNRTTPLRRCLESVARQRRAPLEVIVLDDASDRVDVAAYVASLGLAGVRVLRSEEQRGVGPGRNVLLQAARGEVCFFLDDDAWMERDDVLERVASGLAAQPGAAILAARIVDHAHEVPRDLVPFPRRTRRTRPEEVHRPQLVSYFLGGAHAIRRDTLDRIGAYDEGFVWGEEELDLSYRAIQAGFDIWYDPGVVVEHAPETPVLASARRPARELYYHVRNRLFIARKYLPLRYAVPYLAIWLARYLGLAIRDRALADFVRGMMSGTSIARSRPRTPIEGRALAYLERHHGRLLY